MITSLIGTKGAMTQIYSKKGSLIPVTKLQVLPNVVVQVKSLNADGYNAVQLGYGEVKKVSKPLKGHLRKTSVESLVHTIREFRHDGAEVLSGTKVSVQEVFRPGDMIRVQSESKGKGFAGGVKRWGFSGGPKTHGQTDRHRAPGSIGAGTTPGRVYKGRKMAGRMGGDIVTVENLTVVKVWNNEIWVMGSVPGSKSALVEISKTGVAENFDFEVESDVVVEPVTPKSEI